jgi:hypothetical protein
MTQRHVLGDKACATLKDDCNNRKNQRELDGELWPIRPQRVRPKVGIQRKATSSLLEKKFSSFAAVCNIDEAQGRWRSFGNSLGGVENDKATSQEIHG